MTSYTYSDDFSSVFDKKTWMLHPPGTDIIRHANYYSATASVDGEFMTYNPGSAYRMTGPATDKFTVQTGAVPSGYESGDAFVGYCNSVTAGTKLTAGESYVFQLQSDGTLHVYDASAQITGTESGDYEIYFQEFLKLPNQRQQAVVYSTDEKASNYVVLWNRFDPRKTISGGAPLKSGFQYGYGCQLLWNLDGTRTLKIVKIDPNTPYAIVELASTDVTLLQVDSSDFGVGQLLTFDTIDEDGLEAYGGTNIQVFLNSVDDTTPTLSYTDRGGLEATRASPSNEERAGVFGFTFGEGDGSLYLDSWEGSDGFAYYRKTKPDGRTLGQLRTALKEQLANGGNSSYQDSFVDEMINDSIAEVLDELGDRSEFSRAMKTLTFTADIDQLVTLPHYMDRVISIFDDVTKEEVKWNLINRDEADRLVVFVEGAPAGRDFMVSYVKRWEPLVDDSDICPIPRRWDDVVRNGVMLRVAGEADQNPNYEKSLEKRYMRRLSQLKKTMSTYARFRKPKMTVRTRNPLERLPSNWGTR